MDQNQSPVADNLAIFARDPVHGFGGPGHHRGRGAPAEALAALGDAAFRADILTPKGLDDRTKRFHVMEQAEVLAADAWGADAAFYGTSGTTQNLQALLLSLAAPGDSLLVAGNDHRASFSLALTSGLTIVPLTPAYDAERDVENGVTAATVEAALAAHPEAKAVVIVSPTFFGVTSDVRAIAAVTHARGLPLIVDAAWGGAFAFSAALPPCPLTLGVDAMVTSVHKTMGALAQGSVILLRGDKVDPDRLQRTLDCIQTTSPSVPILASLDLARRAHVRHGEALWRGVLERVDAAASRIAALGDYRVHGDERLGAPGVADLDRSKLVIDVSALGISGFDADEWLQSRARVSVVLSDARHLVATFSIGNDASDVDALVAALAALRDAVARGELRRATPGAGYDAIERGATVMLPARAARAASERVGYADAVGRIAAELVAPAPPEVPRLMPGERVTAATAAWLTHADASGAFIPGAEGDERGTMLVVREPG